MPVQSLFDKIRDPIFFCQQDIVFLLGVIVQQACKPRFLFVLPIAAGELHRRLLHTKGMYEFFTFYLPRKLFYDAVTVCDIIHLQECIPPRFGAPALQCCGFPPPAA